MSKVEFKCKACGWSKSVSSEWSDIRPRYCGNAKCKYCPKGKKTFSSFMKEPDMLEIKLSSIVQQEPAQIVETVIEPVEVIEEKQVEDFFDKKDFRKKRRG